MSAYLEHSPRYHAGISKWECLAQQRVGRYWFDHSPYNRMRTYGAECHFGGWCCFRSKAERQRMRREWRKRARREAKQQLEESMHD